MPNDAREQIAQRLGQIVEQARNGAATEESAPQDATPEAPEVEIEPEESEVDASQSPEGDEDAELKQELQPNENDAPDVAEHKKNLLKRLERSERRNAAARKQAQVDPEVARKAQAFDLLSQSPDFAKLAGGALQGQRPTAGVSDMTAEEKGLRDWFGNDEGFDKMREFMRYFVKSEVYPQMEQRDALLGNLANRAIDNDWSKLEDKYGDLSEWKDAAFTRARSNGMSLFDALLLESKGDVVKNEKVMNDKTKQRKSLTTPTQGGAAGAYSRPKPKQGGSTREDRVRAFAQGVQKRGLDVPWARWGASRG